MTPSFRKPGSSPPNSEPLLGDAFKDTAFKPEFEIVKFENWLYSRSHSLLRKTDTTNGFLASNSFRYGLVSVSHSRINPFSTAGKRIGA
jgi:hypothetical protein